MKFALLFASFVATSVLIYLPQRSAILSESFQNSCSSFIHNPHFHKSSDTSSEIVDAYLCGVDLPEGGTKSLFIQTSLYHLIVVSGSHLVFISLILEVLLPSMPFGVHLLLYLLLALMTGLQPPILRALFCAVAMGLGKSFRLHWSRLFVIFFGSFSCLCFFPDWIGSLSFLLSLGATLSLFAGKILVPKNQKHPKLWNHVLVYIFLLPLLWGWGQLHPLGILTNLLIAPALSVSLWTLCGIWLFLPGFGDLGFELLLKLLSEVSEWMPLVQPQGNTSILLKWVYVMILVFALWTMQVQLLRNQETHGVTEK